MGYRFVFYSLLIFSIVTAFFLFTTYFISPKGLTLLRPPFRYRFIPIENIVGMLLLSEEQTSELMEGTLRDVSIGNENISELFHKVKKNRAVLRYYTNSKAFHSSDGRHIYVGKTIVLQLIHNRLVLLSPVKAEAFKSKLEAHIYYAS